MRTATLTLAVLAVLALSASTASAAHMSATLVGHYGQGYYGQCGPVFVPPPVYGYPAIGYARPMIYPRVVYPPVHRVYRTYPYSYRRQSYFDYHGNGFGISIGF